MTPKTSYCLSIITDLVSANTNGVVTVQTVLDAIQESDEMMSMNGLQECLWELAKDGRINLTPDWRISL